MFIPDEKQLRDLTFYLGNRFILPESEIVDLGCGNGDAIAPFVAACDESIKFVCVDTSKDVVQAIRERFSNDSRVIVLQGDLTTFYPPSDASLVLSTFVLQSVPFAYRMRYLRNVYNHLRPGGALIFAEQVKANEEGIVGDVINDAYMSMKADLRRDDKSEPGKLLDFWENDHLLGITGFRQYECFWRSLNCAAWLAVKND